MTKKIGTKFNERSGTGLVQTTLRLSLLIVVVKGLVAQINIIFLISHLVFTSINQKRIYKKTEFFQNF